MKRLLLLLLFLCISSVYAQTQFKFVAPTMKHGGGPLSSGFTTKIVFQSDMHNLVSLWYTYEGSNEEVKICDVMTDNRVVDFTIPEKNGVIKILAYFQGKQIAESEPVIIRNLNFNEDLIPQIKRKK